MTRFPEGHDGLLHPPLSSSGLSLLLLRACAKHWNRASSLATRMSMHNASSSFTLEPWIMFVDPSIHWYLLVHGHHAPTPYGHHLSAAWGMLNTHLCSHMGTMEHHCLLVSERFCPLYPEWETQSLAFLRWRLGDSLDPSSSHKPNPPRRFDCRDC